MYELIPILSGVVAGALAARLSSQRLRALLIGAVAALSALIASLASGELAESWLFLAWDATQAAGAAVLTMSLVTVAHRARGRREQGRSLAQRLPPD